MGLLGINDGGWAPQKQKGPTVLEQIALGVDTASKVLGAGIQAYKTWGPNPKEDSDIALQKAQTNYYQTHANDFLSPNYMLANPTDVKAGIGHEVPGGVAGQLYVPKQELQWQANADMHSGVTARTEKKDENSAFFKAKQDLEMLRGNPALQMAQRNLLLAENAKAVVSPYANDLKQTPHDQVALFDTEMAKMAMGGTPTEAEMHSISDPTLYKEMTSLVSKIKNAPQGAGAAEFLPNKIRYLNDVQKNSTDLIERNYTRKLNDWKSKLSPEDYAQLKSGMNDFMSAYKNSGLQTESGPNGNAVLAPGPTSMGAPSIPKAGDVQDGHVFKGGNPADPNSWVKQ